MLKVENLCKEYPSFKLKNVSFHLPKGYITGFIGMNGAGKTTTLKCILNLVKPDSGCALVLGKNMYENEVALKEEIGFMFGPTDFYSKSPVYKVTDVYKRFFRKWDDNVFSGLLKRFSIDPGKKISDLSSGMKSKLGIALALAHDAKLIILDEPTSGLDPIARDDLLDLFREITESGERSILFSTHITSDLDKCADYIIFIRDGGLVADSTKDDLIADHVLVKGRLQDLTDALKAKLISCKTNSFGFSGLMLKKDIAEARGLQSETPNLEDIMVYYNREDAQK